MITPVVLMSRGWKLSDTENGGKTGARVYFDAATRPDKTPVALPVIGDEWDSTFDLVFCINIDKVPIGEDASAGFMYSVQYSTYENAGDILTDEVVQPQISVNVSTGGEFDSYTLDSETTTYKTTNLTTFTEIVDNPSISRMSLQTNVQITARYIGTIESLIAENNTYAGRLNTAAMWGVPRGNILLTGVTAQPVKVIVLGTALIKWNRTYNYSIRHLKDISSDTWQYVFHQGKYVVLANAENSAGINALAPYLYAALPNPL